MIWKRSVGHGYHKKVQTYRTGFEFAIDHDNLIVDCVKAKYG